MFYLNFGALAPKELFNDLKTTSGTKLNGACLIASGYDHARLTRNELPEAEHLLFDPQLYLCGLPYDVEDKRIERLASHPWFLVAGAEQYDSEKHKKRKDWKAKIRAAAEQAWTGRCPGKDLMTQACKLALETQANLGCSSLILPTPLLMAREDEATPAVDWITAGVTAAKAAKYKQPLLATVAVFEGTLNDAAFDSLGFIDAVVSQVSSCRGISGVYVVVVQQGNPEHPFESKRNVWRAYAALCRRFKRARSIETVIVNFCDVAGFVCMALGADGFATGNFQSTRRVNLPCTGDGRPYPYFYSHACVAELNTEFDMEPIAKARRMDLADDVSPFSKILVETLRKTGSVSGLTNWARTLNNVGEGQRHLIYRLNEVALALAKLPMEQRHKAVTTWLARGVKFQDDLSNLLDEKATRYVLSAENLKYALDNA